MRWIVPILVTVLASPLIAQEFVETEGVLADEDFYRVVSCAAPPGGDCVKPHLRWPTNAPVTVALERLDRAFLGKRAKRTEAAITRALQYINAAGAGITLTRAKSGEKPDITIYMIDTDGSEPISGTGIKGVDGSTVTGARVTVWSNRQTRLIQRATVVFSTRLHISHYESAMIEELTQALGLLTDIRNPVYEGISVFSQDSNAAKTLGPQDVYALRRHYPPTQ